MSHIFCFVCSHRQLVNFDDAFCINCDKDLTCCLVDMQKSKNQKGKEKDKSVYKAKSSCLAFTPGCNGSPKSSGFCCDDTERIHYESQYDRLKLLKKSESELSDQELVELSNLSEMEEFLESMVKCFKQ